MPGTSRSTQRRILEKTLTFLKTLSKRRDIRELLARRGYMESDHQEGWEKLFVFAGYRPGAHSPPPKVSANVQEAMRQVDAWDEPNFAIAKATLLHRYPAQHDFLFENLAPAQGPESVLTVSTFLNRLDALENMDTRGDREEADDKAAIALLEKRGITKGERNRLRDLLEIITQGAQVDALPEEDDSSDMKSFLGLRAWYDEWSAISRAVIRRRDYLIALGLAKPRKSTTTEG